VRLYLLVPRKRNAFKTSKGMPVYERWSLKVSGFSQFVILIEDMVRRSFPASRISCLLSSALRL
jgi:hypothetical protein